jgi:hypothetical protein
MKLIAKNLALHLRGAALFRAVVLLGTNLSLGALWVYRGEGFVSIVLHWFLLNLALGEVLKHVESHLAAAVQLLKKVRNLS